jgi:hypothetical protein
MPNHVTNRLLVAGKKAAVEFMRDLIVNDKGEVDFEVIEPMPEICSSVATGACTIDGEKVTCWIEDEHGNKRKLSSVEEAELRVSGGDWYTWAISHWGTKWNAYDGSVDEIHPLPKKGEYSFSCYFQTAWACPMPWFEKLAARTLEGITLTLEWADEDFGQNTGYAIKNGMGLEVEELPGGSDLAMDHAADILGYDPREEEDWLDADAEEAEEAAVWGKELVEELAGKKSTDKIDDKPTGPAAGWSGEHDWEEEVYN